MLRIQNILCPVDFSEFSARAFEYAQSLAEHYHAALIVGHVVQPLAISYLPYGYAGSYSSLELNLRGEAEKQLQEFVKTHARNGIKPTSIVLEGGIVEGILRLADERSVDLIVMGTHGRRGLDHAAFGSVTERVLRRSRCPVLAVRKPVHEFVTGSEKDHDPVHLRKILLCTDFSEYANRALDYALSLMTEYHAELTLLHVLESLPASADLEQATVAVRQQLEGLVPAGIEDQCKIVPSVRWGKPYLEIVQFCLEAETDLVILGVRGRNAVDLALFGSTTHRVIQLGPCPVLTVHV